MKPHAACRNRCRSAALALGLAVAALVLSATQLIAEVIPPIGLAPGSQYQLIFVTAGTHDAASTDISDYNAFVTAEAALNPSLPLATWHAVASTVAVNANVNAPSGALPVYNTAGVQVAAAGVGIYSGSLVSAVLDDQYGASAFPRTWTGSTGTGIAFPSHALGEASPEIGFVVAPSHLWLEDLHTVGNDAAFPLYALSTAITFVPEPSALVLAALALVGGLPCLRRRTRR